jgi:sugar/nucleoside kinase (ribokinase family)
MKLRMLGIGDNVVDKYLNDKLMYPGGNALNFAVYCRMLNCDAAYIGGFGDDDAARHIQKVLDELSIDWSRSRSVSGENGYACVNVVDGDRIFVWSNKNKVLRENPMVLDHADLCYLADFDFIHTSINSYIEEELPKMRQAGKPIGFDFSNRGTYDYLKMVCPLIDFASISLGSLPQTEIELRLQQIAALGCHYVIGTMGSQGAILYHHGEILRQPPQLLTPVDTLGAGDAFFAAFIVHFMSWLKQKQLDINLNQVCSNYTAILQQSLQYAASFASQICLINGAFGYGVPF